MMYLKCKECEIEISHKISTWCLRNLRKHIEIEHNTSFMNYVIKHDHHGEHPVCACGCGNKLTFNKGKFGKYFGDHKNHVIGVYKCYNQYKTLDDRLDKMDRVLMTVNISRDAIIDYFNKWTSYEMNSSMISEKIGIDWRTIRGYWINLDLADKEDIKRISKKHQTMWSDVYGNAGGRKHIIDETLVDICTFMEKNKGKYTLSEIKSKFSIKHSALILYKRLKERFGENTIKNLLKLGNSSKTETEFLNVLGYYFSNLDKQYPIEGKFFDAKLGDKILIEFDGEYWHSLERAKINDKEKNEIAKKNGFTLIRVKDSESKNIEILIKIKSIYDKIERSR